MANQIHTQMFKLKKANKAKYSSKSKSPDSKREPAPINKIINGQTDAPPGQHMEYQKSRMTL